MSTVKTAISLKRTLFEEVERISQELHITRSKIFADAITDYIQKLQNQQLLEKLNTAYVDKPDRTEKKRLDHARVYHRRLVKGQW